jgi:hypothetical protein
MVLVRLKRNKFLFLRTRFYHKIFTNQTISDILKRNKILTNIFSTSALPVPDRGEPDDDKDFSATY